MRMSLITRRDAPNAVVMSQDYFDSLMETVHLLRSPANVAHLERSIAQLRDDKIAEGIVDDAERVFARYCLSPKRGTTISTDRPRSECRSKEWANRNRLKRIFRDSDRAESTT
jgi:antitoxin YefM